MKIAVFCVGNRLMLDDGIGPAVYDELVEHYEIPEGVDLYDLGCMTMKLLNKVDEYDFIITVDAVDGTDSEPGTVFRYKPEDIARTHGQLECFNNTFSATLCSIQGYDFEEQRLTRLQRQNDQRTAATHS